MLERFRPEVVLTYGGDSTEVFEKLIKGKKGEVPMQNLVYWTDQALQEDRTYHRRATLGWWGVAVLSLVTVGMGVLIFYKPW